MDLASGGGYNTSIVLGRLAVGDAPEEAMQLFLRARLTGIPKRTQGTRVLACGGVPRRLVGRASSKHWKEDIKEAAGPQQFGVGIPAGTEVLHKTLSVRSETHPDHCFVALDVSNAFTSICRGAAAAQIDASLPSLAPLYRAWYCRSSLHQIGDGRARAATVSQSCGLDQGCPLSPAFFAAAIARPLAEAQAEARQRAGTREIWVYAYLDDLYVVVPAAHLDTTLQIIRDKMGALGLRLHPAKFKAWRPSGNAGLPPGASAWATDALPCLGSHLQWVRNREGVDEDEWRDTPVGQNEGGDGVTASVAGLRSFVDRLRVLEENGLDLQMRILLFRNYVNGAVTHRQRARRGRAAQWEQYDDVVFETFQRWLGDLPAPRSRRLIFVPARMGGLGFLSAAQRSDAAYLASWEMSADSIVRDLGAHSEREVLAAAPTVGVHVRQSTAALWQFRAPVQRRRPPERGKGRQKELVEPVVLTQLKALRGGLARRPLALHQSMCTSQGRAWLLPPTEENQRMGNDAMAVSLRRRLLCSDPAGRALLPCGHVTRKPGAPVRVCPHQAQQEDFGVHPVTCDVGPGFVARHDPVRDVWYKALGEIFGPQCVTREEIIPAWRRVRPGREPEDAKLDVVLRLPGERAIALDIAITEAASDSAIGGAGAMRPGRAARAREADKHLRYPANPAAPELVPIIYEAGGRAGEAAERFLRRACKNLEETERIEMMRRIRQAVAVAIQKGNAEMLLSPGAPQGGWPWRRAQA